MVRVGVRVRVRVRIRVKARVRAKFRFIHEEEGGKVKTRCQEKGEIICLRIVFVLSLILR